MKHRSLIFAALVLLALSLALPYTARIAQAAGPDRAACLSNPFGAGCTAGLPTVEYQMLLDEMLLHPQPDVRPLPPNIEEIARFAFRKIVGGSATVYDAPGGNPVGSIDNGFNFVSVGGVQGDWIQVNEGQWMPASQLAVVRPSEYAGIYLDGDLTYPMAWVLVPAYPSAAPGQAGDQSRPLLQRYTRFNIFASVDIEGWQWYLVGPEMWIKQTNVARILFVDRPPQVKGRWFAVDLYEQVMVAYEEDQPVFATLVSSGLEDWATNEGLFNVWSRQVNGHMSGAEGQADFYSLENVPWVMYFDDAISLHGTYWHDGFGYRHSHGCVNLTITDAHWAFNWSMDGGFQSPFVYVYSSGEYR
ncbi:MAG: L,D-transpeptidase [Chloroflexi bacterium]|nr:L,D-transpeptidase [Chloroflexota bacterium]